MIKELFVSYMIPLYDKNALEKVVHTNHIRFIILHGSQATQREHEGSDIDIAFLPKNTFKSKNTLALYRSLIEIFNKAMPSADVDIKSLKHSDPLFRFEVVRDGILLYGDSTDYEEYKAVTFRMYDDAKPLFDLEHSLVLKYQKHLNALHY